MIFFIKDETFAFSYKETKSFNEKYNPFAVRKVMKTLQEYFRDYCLNAKASSTDTFFL